MSHLSSMDVADALGKVKHGGRCPGLSRHSSSLYRPTGSDSVALVQPTLAR